jgi:FkbM family methyltransferase
MKVANYADLLKFADDVVPMPDFVEKTRADFAEYGNRWCDLFNRLADAESKKVLEDVLCFRLSADPRYMVEYHVRFSDQYFEDFLHLDKEIFVDAGGFNGDTTEEFCRRYPTYKKVILFEPSQKNMCDAKQRLAKYRDIEFHQLGLSSAGGVLQFNQDAGSASAVSEAGLEQIIVSTLDSAYVDSVTFIKMDLEGWELQALSGARKHILCDHPILAISVYHNASDFWSVPNFILGLRDDYDLFLRHYSEGWSESVMFFVPRKSSI